MRGLFMPFHQKPMKQGRPGDPPPERAMPCLLHLPTLSDEPEEPEQSGSSFFMQKGGAGIGESKETGVRPMLGVPQDHG